MRRGIWFGPQGIPGSPLKLIHKTPWRCHIKNLDLCKTLKLQETIQMQLRVPHKYRIMLQCLRQSSCFMETIFQEVQKNTAERLSYAGSEFNSFHKFNWKSPPVCWNFTTVKFQEIESQLSCLMQSGKLPLSGSQIRSGKWLPASR